MEQHPVPQNVTTFQFRLIGDMTLKQFGYLCAGAILAYVSYKLPFPFFFTWPLTVFFALLGIGFAFVPVEERPMDVWVLSFFKSIYSPTQYVWSRQTARHSPQPASLEATSTKPQSGGALSGLQIHTMTTGGPVQWLSTLFTQKSKTTPSQTSSPTVQPTPTFSLGPIPSVVGRRVQPEAKEKPARTPGATREQIQQTPQAQTALDEKDKISEIELPDNLVSNTRLLELQQQLTQLLTEKRVMEEELLRLRRSAPTRAELDQDTIKIIPPGAATKAGLPRLTTFPNVVTGIVKDTAGNLLPSVLVTVRDTDGVPLRAFKTNKLGQFAASTPLPVGTYLVEVEDPRDRYVFDRAQIVVNNTLIPAIEVIAKSQKELERAKLAQQIFGNTQ